MFFFSVADNDHFSSRTIERHEVDIPDLTENNELTSFAKRQNRTSSGKNLDDIFGFTRHERLDVKKPGPPADIPLEDHPAINASAVKASKNEAKNAILTKVKKVLHFDIDDDHAPHSVDTEFAHIILKTPYVFNT